MASPSAPRLIAFHLPQFHPDPVNDAAWGKGFTEWTHVARARRLYPGHYQPRVPADLGFYDLRVPEVRQQQAELARQYGIEGFCYWHYWFAGRRVLERPVREIAASGQPDFPFCLGWGNASWTGAWYGAPDRMLVEQTYPGPEDHRAHFAALLPLLRDERYIQVDGRPLFLVFEPRQIPAVAEFCALWRDLAKGAGLRGLHLVGFGDPDWNPREDGFDASVLRGPRMPWPRGGRFLLRSLFRAARMPALFSYRAFVRRGFPEIVSPLDYPVATSNWDTTPRSGRRGAVLHGATPELFRRHLREALDRVAGRSPQQRIVFLKSWNEWAEGNHLEPDHRFGHGFLEAVLQEALRAEREWCAEAGEVPEPDLGLSDCRA